MFGALKEKLKGWLTKNKEPEVEETPKKKKQKKEQKKEKSTIKNKKEQKKDRQKKTVRQEKTNETEIIQGEFTLPPEKKDDIHILAPSFVKEVSLQQEKNEQKEQKKSFFSSFFKKELTKEKFDEIFEELELILLQNNVATSTVEAIRTSLEKSLVGKNLKDVNLAEELKKSIRNLLIEPPLFLQTIKESLAKKKPFVIVFAGINGSGKTTTIAKITHYLKKHKLSVCLAAADTFRAAAVEQLQQHANNLQVPLIKKDYGSDPAAVGFEAIVYAKKNHHDLVLIDTAGRMQNKDSLMKEMEKIVRVTQPDMRIFLGESITGNDATEQAKAFNEAMNLTGIVLSKADVDEKGGTAISVAHVTGKPVIFLGTGQSYDDLEPFDKEKLIQKLGL